jgi:hypothetical protein
VTPTPTTDRVTIYFAAHYQAAGIVRVVAFSSSPTAILDVYDHTTNTFIGTIPTAGGGGAFFDYAPYPPEMRVESDQGGVAVAAVVPFP